MAKDDEANKAHDEDEDPTEGDEGEGDEEEEEEEASADGADEEDEEEEEDEEDDVEDAAPAKAAHGHEPPPPPPPPTASSEDPTWWAPHAVLATLVVVGVLGFFGSFNKWLKPLVPGPAPTFAAATSAPAAPPAAAPQAPKPNPAQPQQPGAQQPGELFGAKHLVVQYKGATRAPAPITRTKEEAKARAEEALKKLTGGAKWDDIVGEYSDEPGAGKRGGNLGNFRKGSMDKRFQAAVEALKLEQMSGVVETDFGFHIIIRTR